jgi:hypothetical protein
MMIANYDNDTKMAEFGRYCAKNKAMREAREAIRDIAVALGNASDVEAVSNLRDALNGHIDNLVEAMKL